MAANWNLVITDTNPLVRKLLKRELMAEGYVVFDAKNWRDILDRIYGRPSVQLIVLDPELLAVPFHLFFLELRDRVPPIHVVVHAFSELAEGLDADMQDVVIVEKRSRSIETLKTIINALRDGKGYEHRQST